MEKYYEKSCDEFTRLTFSKDPVPGGGSVAALAGALGASLSGMVASLTEGKKKYAAYGQDIRRILSESEELRQRFFRLMDEDMENFLPLSRVYGLPKETAEEKKFREEELDRCLRLAVQAPLHLIEACRDCVPLFEELTEKGSRLALSDVGCGASLIRSCAECAWLNVLININMIRDPGYTEPLREQYEKMVAEISAACGRIYQKVSVSL